MSARKGAVSVAPEFPRTLAAAQKAESNLWMIADAVLFEIGPPPDHGWQDGSRARIEECAVYLAERGLDYSPDRLRHLRETAHVFTEGNRSPSVTFTAHQFAGSPEVLAEAIRRNDGKPPTTRFVQQVRREIREAEESAQVRAERERRETERKAAEIAEALEDKRVAKAVVASKTLGSRRIITAVREQEATRRRKVREENERITAAGAMPLPAYVPEMIAKITEWSGALAALADDIGSLPRDEPLVSTLHAAVAELWGQADRWLQALSETPVAALSTDDVIEGRAA